MSTVLPFQGKRLVPAGELSDRHMGRVCRIGMVEGDLAGLMPHRHGVDVVLIVGGARAVFPMDHTSPVEVGPAKERR